jgi:hypothetical protein
MFSAHHGKGYELYALDNFVSEAVDRIGERSTIHFTPLVLHRDF